MVDGRTAPKPADHRAWSLGLLAASGSSSRPEADVLGLDLRAAPSSSTRDGRRRRLRRSRRTRSTARSRSSASATDTLGVSEPEISRVGSDGIQVGLPERPERRSRRSSRSAPPRSSTSTTSRRTSSRRPEHERPERSRQAADPNPSVYAFPNLYEAVKFAAKRKPECVENKCTTNGPTYYLFDTKTKQLIAGPAENDARPVPRHPKREAAAGHEDPLRAAGDGRGRRRRPVDSSTLSQTRPSCSNSPQFVLTDRPALSGTDITNPSRTSTRRRTSRTSPSTSPTRARRRSRTSPRRSPSAAARPRRPGRSARRLGRPVLAALRDRARQPDRRPSRSSTSSTTRTGSTAAPGAQISGSFTISSAQDLAEILQIGALPVDLDADQPEHGLGDARPAGARSGPEGRDRSAWRWSCLFLLLYYRLLGAGRGARAGDLRASSSSP